MKKICFPEAFVLRVLQANLTVVATDKSDADCGRVSDGAQMDRELCPLRYRHWHLMHTRLSLSAQRMPACL
jgi:hypothetical protein